MKLINQYHDKYYPDTDLIDLRPNSTFMMQLPSEILTAYTNELDKKVDNLIPPHVHKFLTDFFQQNLTGEDWHEKIDDLICPDKNDILMKSVVRIIRKTLPSL